MERRFPSRISLSKELNVEHPPMPPVGQILEVIKSVVTNFPPDQYIPESFLQQSLTYFDFLYSKEPYIKNTLFERKTRSSSLAYSSSQGFGLKSHSRMELGGSLENEYLDYVNLTHMDRTLRGSRIREGKIEYYPDGKIKACEYFEQIFISLIRGRSDKLAINQRYYHPIFNPAPKN